MEAGLLHAFGEILHRHWMSAFFILLTLLTIVVVSCMSWLVRRHLRRMMEVRFEDDDDLDALPSPGPRDREALELVKRYRGEIWNLPDAELQLSIEALNQRAMTINHSIAAVYHPEAEIPQYEASLHELLMLIRRVSARLSRIASGTPFKFLAVRKLSDYQRYYQVYKKINENPILQVFKKNPYVYKAAQLAWNLKNLGNPLYWAGKELSREGYFFMLRWFYIVFISQVGKEAVRLYSGRHFQTEEDRDAVWVCYRLFMLTEEWGGPSGVEWKTLVDFVTGLTALETENKLHILSRCAQGKRPGDLEASGLHTEAGVKWYRQGLKRILSSEKIPSCEKASIIDRETKAAAVKPVPAVHEENTDTA